MVMPSNRWQTGALLAGQQKAARALHRAAPETTADCAVPPLFHQSTNPQKVASKRNNIGTPRRSGAVRGWPSRKPTTKLVARLHSRAILSQHAAGKERREINDADRDLGPRSFAQSRSGGDGSLA
jgi:hypothetical protein